MKRILVLTTLSIICITTIYAFKTFRIDEENIKYLLMNSYMVKFSEVSLSDAFHFANLFASNMKEAFFEDENSFVFENEIRRLTVYKYQNKISYRLFQIEDTLPLQAEIEPQKAALDFFKKKRLPFSYEEIHVDFDGEFYTVKLINMLGDIPLHAFNNVITVDAFGNVIGMDYFNVEFFKYKSVLLNSSSSPDAKIVYIYENSIVTPVYLTYR